MKKKKIKESEADVKPPKKKEAEPAHADAAQDVELIKKMIAEYVGGDDHAPEEQEAMEKLAHEAFGAHKEMGANEQEAYERAGHALKLAKHMASKQSEGESEGEEKPEEKPEDKKPVEPAEAEGESETESEACEDESEVEAKESNRVKSLEKKLLESAGRIAALEQKLTKGEVERYVEAELAKSKLPKAVTKKFREKAGDIKSKADFDSKWGMFLEGARNTQVELDWGVLQEKSVLRESEETAGGRKGLDFSSAASEEI